jgi:hypothetical protein
MAGSKGRGSFVPFFRIIKFTRNLPGARRMVRYIAFRSRELEEDRKGAFDAERDHADVNRFCERLDDWKTRHPKAAKAYHCLFSLPRGDFDRTGMADWKEVVRDTLASYERAHNRKLDWIASEHKDPKHPHCHVVIKAVYESGTGARRQLRLSKADIQEIRQTVGQELSRRREAYRALHPEPARDNSRGFDFAGATGQFMRWLQHRIERDRWEREREMESAHQRWLREGEERER